jgi:ribonuclease BN (tRNA processing enzyme)
MGWMPAEKRQTCCYCLEVDNRLIILDAGTGLSRFAEPAGQSLLKKYQEINILISHYHLDHIIGLIYLPRFFKEKTVHIAGPGKSIYGKRAEDILTQMITPPYFGRPLKQFPMKFHFYDPDETTEQVNGIPLQIITQEHRDPSLGIKLDNSTCYITDTCCSSQTIPFARNCQLLLHECWFDSQDYIQAKYNSPSYPELKELLKFHSHIDGVVDIALKAKVHSLMLIHLNPTYSENRLNKMSNYAKKLFSNSILAADGLAMAI